MGERRSGTGAEAEERRACAASDARGRLDRLSELGAMGKGSSAEGFENIITQRRNFVKWGGKGRAVRLGDVNFCLMILNLGLAVRFLHVVGEGLAPPEIRKNNDNK